MSTFSFISKIFAGEPSLSAEEQSKLFEEVMLLTLARASRADLDISTVEIEKIQQILRDATGMEASEKDIRVAGNSELYEVAPLDKYVAKAAKGLSVAQRHTVLVSLYDVIGADGKFNHAEADFYDLVANALNLRPFEMMGAEIDGAE